MQKRFHPHSLYTQILIMFLLLLIPVQLIGCALHMHSAAVARANTIEKSESMLVNAVGFLSKQIEILYQQVYSDMASENSNFRQLYSTLSQTPSSKYWIAIRQIMQQFKWTMYNNDAIEEMTVYYPTQGLCVSSSEYHRFTRDTQNPIWQKLCRTNTSLLQKDGDSLLMNLSASHSNNSAIRLQIRLSLEKLCRMAEEKLYVGTCIIGLQDVWLFSTPEETAYFSDHSVENGMKILLNGSSYYVFHASDTQYSLSLISLVPSDVFDATAKSLYTLFIFYAILSILVLIAYAYIVRKIVHRPICSLMEGFRAIQSGNMQTHVCSSGPEEFCVLIQGFNDMSENLNSAMQTILEQKAYVQQIELKQLQSQINPHFLYNMLFMLERSVEDGDGEVAQKACRYLGNYFQYITHTDTQIVSLQDDYAHAMNYMMLQKLRYEERIHLEMADIPEQIADMAVPRLIFQPILENIFVHGIHQAKFPMRIRTQVLFRDVLMITVENSGETLPDAVLRLNLDDSSQQTRFSSLKNIHRRIQLQFGMPYGLQLSRSTLGGLMVTILLPLNKIMGGEN